MMNGPQPVSPHSKQILHNSVDVEETLRVVRRSEPAHLPFALSRGLIGGFGAIVRVAGRVVGDRRHDVMRGTVAAQLVGDETTRCLSLAPQQSPKESARRSPVSTRLDEDVDHVAVLIHRAPEILALPVDGHEDFVQEPRISESTLSAHQAPRVVRAELPAPLPNRFV